MRTLNVIKNIGASVGTTLVLTILGFFTRKVFIDNLGVEYLGLNGLLQNVIGMLSLVEGGIGTSIVYNLYKPLAENNRPQIIALVQLYRRIYRWIALGVFLLSLLLYPFLGIFIKGGEGLSYVSVVYFIFVLNNLIGYLMADKWSLINSDQKQYKLAGYNLIYQICLNLIKIAILVYYQNYIAYLIVETCTLLMYNYFVIRKVNQLYSFIQTKIKYTVSTEVKQNILMNVKALFISSIGGYLLHGTDNIIISSFVGIGVVGLYSNYILIVNQTKSLFKPILTSMKDSIGNLVASDTPEKQYEVFKVINLINFFLVSFIVVLFINTLNPFITWWLGEDYLLPEYIVWTICLNFYVDEIRISVMMYKFVSGIFNPDKYVVFITAIINLVVSVLLARYIGLLGVLLGTAISLLCTASWNWPRLVFKYTFKRSVRPYYIQYLFFVGIVLVISWLTRTVNTVLWDNDSTFSTIVYRGIISTIIWFSILFLLYFSSKEVSYLRQSIRVLSKK